MLSQYMKKDHEKYYKPNPQQKKAELIAAGWERKGSGWWHESLGPMIHNNHALTVNEAHYVMANNNYRIVRQAWDLLESAIMEVDHHGT